MYRTNTSKYADQKGNVAMAMSNESEQQKRRSTAQCRNHRRRKIFISVGGAEFW